MNIKHMPLFSFLIPTRKRPEKLKRLFSSICETTSKLSNLEIILAIDEDDEESQQVFDERLNIKKVIVPSGKTMGFLNRACYAASSGRYVMLMNDDVILRTQNWDQIVKKCFATYQQDEIVLVHVNDMIYRERLCTFPFVSRTYCELIGNICPEEYIRYRIDDHIYNIFNMLAIWGYKRIVYLPDVIFEHDNYINAENGQREYVPNEEIIAIDIKWFDNSLGQRKEDTLKLAQHIESKKLKRELERRYSLLADVRESYSIRRPEYIRVYQQSGQLSSASTRVTIGVVSANIQHPHAQKCLQLLKEYTSNYDLVILDNNRGPGFNHPREMNRILSIVRTEYLVLMDDDIFVEPGWLDGLLKSVKDNTGVVTPLHKNKEGNLSYAGVFMLPGETGEHGHIIDIPAGQRPIPTLCSAIQLIDMNKCGHLRFNERMVKYFLDLDYGLQVWELGYEVICTPDVAVTHLAGATLTQGSQAAIQLQQPDRQVFIEDWVETGRLRRLEEGIWQDVPYINSILNVCCKVDTLTNQLQKDNLELFRNQLEALLPATDPFPHLKQELLHQAGNYLASASLQLNQSQNELEQLHNQINQAKGELEQLYNAIQGITPEQYPNPTLLEEFLSYNIVAWKQNYYGLPKKLGDIDVSTDDLSHLQGFFIDQSLERLKTIILNHLGLPSEIERLETRIRAMESSKLWKLRTAWFRLKFQLVPDLITEDDMLPFILTPQANPEQLQARIQAMESSKFWQVRRVWFRLKRALRLTDEDWK